MGNTEGLSKFVRGHFTRWVAVNLNDLERLVIHGGSICNQLYRKVEHACWLLGGEYAHFQTTVREFFAEILFTGVQVLVVFSGVEIEHPGAKSVYHCGTQFNEAVRRAQGRMGWVTTKDRRVLPFMATAVFMDVLRSLGVELRVTNSEAKKEVAAFANHYKCPVLAADSDFFVFELEGGYIPMDKLSTVIASGLVFHTGEFRAEFSIKDAKLLLLLVLFGSGQLEGVEADCNFKAALGIVSAHETCEEYFARGVCEKTLQDFEVLREYYCDLQLPLDHDLKSGMVSELFPNLPQWVAHSFRIGCFEPQLINVHLNNTYVLRALVEDIKRESAWLASRPIRQYLYSFIGVPVGGSVKEVIRAKSSPEVTDVHISPCNLNPPVNLRDFSDMDRKIEEKVVLDVLSDHKLSKDDLFTV